MCRTMVSISAFQAEDDGSIPFTCFVLRDDRLFERLPFGGEMGRTIPSLHPPDVNRCGILLVTAKAGSRVLPLDVF